MERIEPLLFKEYPNLKEKVPWIPLLTNVPTPVERLTKLEKYFNLEDGQIYIKRDDKNHQIYGGNKLRKLEFIFGNIIKRKKKKAIITCGGIGTNHGLACLIACNILNPPLKCDLFLLINLSLGMYNDHYYYMIILEQNYILVKETLVHILKPYFFGFFTVNMILYFQEEVL